MITPANNSPWSAVLCISVVAGTGHIPINKVTLLGALLNAASQGDPGAECTALPASPEPEGARESESSAKIAPAVGCDTWDRAERTSAARLTTLLATVHRAGLRLTLKAQPCEALPPARGSAHPTLPRAASRPHRPHAPPQRG